jgi:hypothetical protein
MPSIFYGVQVYSIEGRGGAIRGLCWGEGAGRGRQRLFCSGNEEGGDVRGGGERGDRRGRVGQGVWESWALARG